MLNIVFQVIHLIFNSFDSISSDSMKRALAQRYTALSRQPEANNLCVAAPAEMYVAGTLKVPSRQNSLIRQAVAKMKCVAKE